jgi:cytochrome P450 / NADPH-cytochrome P450 reductase
LQTHELFKEHGPVILLQIFNGKFHLTNDAMVVKKIFDNPERFPKVVVEGPLMHLRRLAGDGLFTATEGEENWGIAHRILMPAFGRASIQKYAPEISRSARKFIDNLNKFYGSEKDIPLLNWTTKMTFDAIATCGFAYDFNSLDVEEEAPAITWMVDILTESLNRTQRGSIGNWVNIWAERRYSQNIQKFHNLVEEILERRRHEPESERSKRQDLLSLMLNSTDAETGKRLSDLNMIYQCVTFLIAGHETTSTLLSWACYMISQHPAVEQKLLEEVRHPFTPRPCLSALSHLNFLFHSLRSTLFSMLIPTSHPPWSKLVASSTLK